MKVKGEITFSGVRGIIVLLALVVGGYYCRYLVEYMIGGMYGESIVSGVVFAIVVVYGLLVSYFGVRWMARHGEAKWQVVHEVAPISVSTEGVVSVDGDQLLKSEQGKRQMELLKGLRDRE